MIDLWNISMVLRPITDQRSMIRDVRIADNLRMNPHPQCFLRMRIIRGWWYSTVHGGCGNPRILCHGVSCYDISLSETQIFKSHNFFQNDCWMLGIGYYYTFTKWKMRMRIIRGLNGDNICGCGLSANEKIANADHPLIEHNRIRTPLSQM